MRKRQVFAAHIVGLASGIALALLSAMPATAQVVCPSRINKAQSNGYFVRFETESAVNPCASYQESIKIDGRRSVPAGCWLVSGTTYAVQYSNVTGQPINLAASPLEVEFSSKQSCYYNAAVLPIELSRFEAKAENGRVRIEWSTATELNNDYMILERSADGIRFSELARIAGRGTSYEVQDYLFEDKRPLPGLNYYRLRQVDFDGSEEIHPMVSVLYEGKLVAKSDLQAFPNPAFDEIRIQWQPAAGPERVSIRLVDLNGRQLAYFEKMPEQGELILPLGDYPAGLYFLQAVYGEGVQTLSFRKN